MKRLSPAKKDKIIGMEYSEKVISGEILACELVKKACKRFLNDFGRKDIYYDNAAAKKAISFFKYVPHVKGELGGKPIKLELWQEFFIGNIFGWKKGENRRFREVYLEVARKNAKSTMLSAISLYSLLCDNEPGSEIYSAATTRDQSKVVFDISSQMLRQSKFLKGKLGNFKTSIFTNDGSKYEPLSSDYNTLDGKNVHMAVIDELHAHKSRDIYDVIKTATGSRRQPLIVSITTAGYDRHSICYEMNQYTKRVLDNTVQDDTFFGLVYTIDDGDDWKNENVWVKSNPNLGISVKIDDLRQKSKQAIEIPSSLNSFLTKHLCVWTESFSRWITNEAWDACNDTIKTEELIGQTCYAGLDLSTTQDVTALVYVFPYVIPGKLAILCRFFIPSDNMRKRIQRDRVPFDVWVRNGYVIATDGNIIDYEEILRKISNDMTTYDIREIAFDRWGATKIVQSLQQIGFDNSKDTCDRKLIDFGQGFASMSTATKELERLVLSGEIIHNGNPVLNWMMSNVVVSQDAAGNIKPDKSKVADRIDGVVALIMAIDRCSRAIGEENCLVTFV